MQPTKLCNEKTLKSQFLALESATWHRRASLNDFSAHPFSDSLAGETAAQEATEPTKLSSERTSKNADSSRGDCTEI